MGFWELLKRIAKSFKYDPKPVKVVVKKQHITEEILDLVEDSLDKYTKSQKYTYFSSREQAKNLREEIELKYLIFDLLFYSQFKIKIFSFLLNILDRTYD